MIEGKVIAFDTSNYTTSCAVFDGENGENSGRLLDVKPGELGLRQSDALFAHVKRLPEITEKLTLSGDIIAVDATNRTRPNGVSFEEFFKEVRAKYPDQLFMADTSCFEEGKKALELGFDLLGTTMSGYTPYTKGTPLPDFTLMKRYREELGATVIAEGGIWAPDELVKAFESGAHAAVVGTAITRPMDITKRFVKALEESKK